MTAEEAIETIRAFKSDVQSAVDNRDVMPCTREIIEYNTALGEAIEALQKQIPTELIRTNTSANFNTVWRKYDCPSCGMFLYSGADKPTCPQKYCHICGQALKWEDEK